ncbi:hypothetical protein [Bdellovibrio sp. HCB209]|uniref:hypothetical protein n=1 Tax=Bdellovibrio sp. HCB209 TaxID=3394354 RepID=UPI0039B3EA32
MANSKFTALIAGLGFMATLSACSADSDKDKLMEAQLCLDQASQGQADSCVSSLASLSSPHSYALRCSAKFIDSGITTPENLSKALSSIGEDSGSNSSTELLSLLNMGGDSSYASDAADLCSKSGQPGFALMGAMAKSATVLASVSSSILGSCTSIDSCTGSDIETIIDDVTDSLNGSGSLTPAEAEKVVEDIAGAVTTVYSVTCGTSKSNKDICGPIDQALTAAGISDISSVSQADLVALGKELIAKWK